MCATRIVIPETYSSPRRRTAARRGCRDRSATDGLGPLPLRLRQPHAQAHAATARSHPARLRDARPRHRRQDRRLEPDVPARASKSCAERGSSSSSAKRCSAACGATAAPCSTGASSAKSGCSTTLREEHRGNGFGIEMVDHDRFKHYNDTFGHEVGDLVLEHDGTAVPDAPRRRHRRALGRGRIPPDRPNL